MSFVAGCTDSTVGTGFLDVDDLRDPSMPEHFTGEAVELRGRLALRSNGCVTVIVAGAERTPFWPEGTNVSQQPGSPIRYEVALPGGTTLHVDASNGDAFSARGIIDDNPASFEVEDGLPTKVSSHLAYCGVEAPPVAFPDAATFSAL